MTTHARNELLARTKKAQAKRDAITRKIVIRTLMTSQEGRRFVWVELESAQVFAQTWVPGMPDATAFKEGQRSAGLKLLTDVTAICPNEYVLMTRENASVKLDEEPETEEGEDDAT